MDRNDNNGVSRSLSVDRTQKDMVNPNRDVYFEAIMLQLKKNQIHKMNI